MATLAKDDSWNGQIPREFTRTETLKTIKVFSKGELLTTTFQDISLGGIKLNWPTNQDIDAPLIIYFSTDLYFDGNVRWCKPIEDYYEIGVQLPELDEIAAIYLGEYIEQLQEDEPDLLMTSDPLS
ncbi:MAG: PilZ domain-containing protein [SAR324 cluster bacterium]|nr:PilZ domain-containing protein [SAR324 cluster bacterium]